MDRRRHAQLAKARPSRRPSTTARPAHVYRNSVRRTLTDVYDADHVATGSLARLRWLLSTCLAAGVGAVAIGVVIVGSLDTPEQIMPFRLPPEQARPAGDGEGTGRGDAERGLAWAIPRGDRIHTQSGVVAARYIIEEQIQVKRDNRPFIQNRPYVRIAARLAPVPPANADVIPPFNPLKLYSTSDPIDSADGSPPEANGQIATQVVELLGGIIPGEDGQELDAGEAQAITQRALETDIEPPSFRPSLQPEAGDSLTPKDLLSERAGSKGSEPIPPNTTILAKSTSDRDELDSDIERNEVRVVKVVRGDTLLKALQRMGADIWQAKAMAEAAKSLLPDHLLTPGHEVHVTMVPSLQRADRMEPAAYSVFGDGHVHRVSVSRNTSGEFVASASPNAAQLARAAIADDDQPQFASLYAALYNAAILQGVAPDTVMQVLRLHAYETDFRRRVRPTDSIELFFDARPQPGGDPLPGELLYSALTTGGETQRYWRYRSSDGIVDYYDEFGNNSRKFLMRRPVRGDAVRFSSGYGIRRHPLLHEYRMHNGVDWASPIGTPILAAGNGVVEFADRRGEFGNHIRIRHANGYQTTYSHLSRFGPGIRDTVKVRQGQVIGFVGNTGLSAGPHLHFEVLVNNRYVDPMQIQVPRERRLAGKQASDFQRERQRIEELMRRPPIAVLTR